MGDMSCRCRRGKGFRLNSARFSVLRLRLRLLGLIGLLQRCLQCMKKGTGCGGGGVGDRRSRRSGRRWGKSGSRRGLMEDLRNRGQQEGKLRPPGRSNSFHTEAIADCLEFIKRTSVSVNGGSDGGQ
ncbi:unnamed protein product [Spirodela intermedia]|uniref:Uncharacterized protein n=1 Tax=Spirodela intermedia TaxID=51605 RepID=A0A7I8LEE4_SPIIN|nr:unnamed protein product [Spirodela intermedia]